MKTKAPILFTVLGILIAFQQSYAAREKAFEKEFKHKELTWLPTFTVSSSQNIMLRLQDGARPGASKIYAHPSPEVRISLTGGDFARGENKERVSEFFGLRYLSVYTTESGKVTIYFSKRGLNLESFDNMLKSLRENWNHEETDRFMKLSTQLPSHSRDARGNSIFDLHNYKLFLSDFICLLSEIAVAFNIPSNIANYFKNKVIGTVSRDIQRDEVIVSSESLWGEYLQSSKLNITRFIEEIEVERINAAEKRKEDEERRAKEAREAELRKEAEAVAAAQAAAAVKAQEEARQLRVGENYQLFMSSLAQGLVDEIDDTILQDAIEHAKTTQTLILEAVEARAPKMLKQILAAKKHQTSDVDSLLDSIPYNPESETFDQELEVFATLFFSSSLEALAQQKPIIDIKVKLISLTNDLKDGFGKQWLYHLIITGVLDGYLKGGDTPPALANFLFTDKYKEWIILQLIHNAREVFTMCPRGFDWKVIERLEDLSKTVTAEKEVRKRERRRMEEQAMRLRARQEEERRKRQAEEDRRREEEEELRNRQAAAQHHEYAAYR